MPILYRKYLIVRDCGQWTAYEDELYGVVAGFDPSFHDLLKTLDKKQ